MDKLKAYLKNNSLYAIYGFIIFVVTYSILFIICSKWALVNVNNIERIMAEMDYKNAAYGEMIENFQIISEKYDFPREELERAAVEEKFIARFESGTPEDNKTEFGIVVDNYILNSESPDRSELEKNRDAIVNEASSMYESYVKLKLINTLTNVMTKKSVTYIIVLIGLVGLMIMAIYTYLEATRRKLEFLAGFIAAGIAMVFTGILLPHGDGIGVYHELLMNITSAASAKFILMGGTIVLAVEAIIFKSKSKEGKEFTE